MEVDVSAADSNKVRTRRGRSINPPIHIQEQQREEAIQKAKKAQADSRKTFFCSLTSTCYLMIILVKKAAVTEALTKKKTRSRVALKAVQGRHFFISFILFYSFSPF